MDQNNNIPPFGYGAYQSPADIIKQEKKQEKHGLFINASKLGALLLIYEALTYGMNYVYFYLLFFIKSKSFSLEPDVVRDFYKENSSIMDSSFYKMLGNLFIVVVSMLILLLIAKYLFKIKFEDMLRPKASLVKNGFRWFPLSMSMNYAASIAISIVVGILSTAGLTVPEQDFSISDSSAGALAMQFAYVILLGPLCEELLYRGVIITLLRPYGKGLAVFFSALFFGAMHGNIPQFASAFAGGLVFAAVAVKYNSIIPTIVIHILNNTVASIGDFTDVLNVKEVITNHIYYAVFITILIIGFYIIFVKIGEIKPTEERTFVLTASQRRMGVFMNIFVLAYFALLIMQYISSFISANS